MTGVEFKDFSSPRRGPEPRTHDRRGGQAGRRRDRPVHVPAGLALVRVHQAHRRNRLVPGRARRVRGVREDCTSSTTTARPATSRPAWCTGSRRATTPGSSATNQSSSSSSRARPPTQSTEARRQRHASWAPSSSRDHDERLGWTVAFRVGFRQTRRPFPNRAAGPRRRGQRASRRTFHASRKLSAMSLMRIASARSCSSTSRPARPRTADRMPRKYGPKASTRSAPGSSTGS